MKDKQIGKRIQKAREEAGLSQEDLAGSLGLTQSALSNYELGKRRLYLANLQRIAEQLNKPLSCFLEEAEEVRTRSDKKSALDATVAEIVELLSEFSPRDREFILEYVRWMKERSS